MIFHSKLNKYKTFFILKFKGVWLFFRELFSNPTIMGAACPSSKRLARAMAKQIPIGFSGTIVELGAGTGVVTRALLDRGIHTKNLVVIERSSAFVKHLVRRFPKLGIIAGDAQNLNSLLKNYSHINAIVSSLPLRSLPEDTVKNILQAIDKTLSKGGLFIQFTYYHGSTTLALPPSFQRIHSENVLLNFPPAKIDVFSHQQILEHLS